MNYPTHTLRGNTVTVTVTTPTPRTYRQPNPIRADLLAEAEEHRRTHDAHEGTAITVAVIGVLVAWLGVVAPQPWTGWLGGACGLVAVWQCFAARFEWAVYLRIEKAVADAAREGR